MSELNFRLMIIDPTLEITVLTKLIDAGFNCVGRHLDLADLPEAGREHTILITTAELIDSRIAIRGLQGFLAVISVGERSVSGTISLAENEVAKLPEVIRMTLSQLTAREQVVSDAHPMVIGVLPRVGVSTLIEIIERNLGDFLLTNRKRALDEHRQILLAEIDDQSILRLCVELQSRILAGTSNNSKSKSKTEYAVVINKVPATSPARKRLRALEGELQGSGVCLFLPIFFDKAIPVTGTASKSTIRSAQPLFDWIAKAN